MPPPPALLTTSLKKILHLHVVMNIPMSYVVLKKTTESCIMVLYLDMVDEELYALLFGTKGQEREEEGGREEVGGRREEGRGRKEDGGTV